MFACGNGEVKRLYLFDKPDLLLLPNEDKHNQLRMSCLFDQKNHLAIH